ncbi:unnamed protein product [Lactuca saligna]|uniref:Uncharacterized protein n=1 Tax=Lactuca saligna TaxID=75948 RepID=A0AA35VGB9_LACSI|nr:unnamed protein product [Lactuca saligna]
MLRLVCHSVNQLLVNQKTRHKKKRVKRICKLNKIDPKVKIAILHFCLYVFAYHENDGAFCQRRLHLWPTTSPPLADDASVAGLRSTTHTKSPNPAYSCFRLLLLSHCFGLRLRPTTPPPPVSGRQHIRSLLQRLPPPPSFTLFTGMRLYIRNLPLHIDQVLVQTTKSRRICMVERKTRKRSVGKPKSKHLEARHTMDRPEKKKRSVTLIRDHSKDYLSNLTVEFGSVGVVIHVFRNIHRVELAD